MEIGIGFWIFFFAFVLVMLTLDLFVFHKKDTVPSIKASLLWSLFWIGLAVAFNVGVLFFLGEERALEFFTAYLIEESLSIDNLFVFILIFGFFKIAPQYQHKVLFWGIIGAIVMRAVFIFAGVALLNKFDWIMYVFGAFLLYTGIKMMVDRKETSEFNPNDNFIIRVFRKLMPVTEDMSVPHFFVKKHGKVYATTYFIALLFIEASDLVFAVDSIPAVLSVSKEVFIVYTSNIFAILGLRSLYFALNGIMQYFRYLKLALAGILTFIGFKMCINEFCAEMGYHFHISNLVSLAVIIGFLTTSILASVLIKEKNEG
jgi:tellurite resistance protein TerC